MWHTKLTFYWNNVVRTWGDTDPDHHPEKNWNISHQSEHIHNGFIPQSAGSLQWPQFLHDLSPNLHRPLCPYIQTEAQIQPDAHTDTSGWTGPNSHCCRHPQASTASHVRPHHLGESWALTAVICSGQASDTHHERRGCTNYPFKYWRTMDSCWSKN